MASVANSSSAASVPASASASPSPHSDFPEQKKKSKGNVWHNNTLLNIFFFFFFGKFELINSFVLLLCSKGQVEDEDEEDGEGWANSLIRKVKHNIVLRINGCSITLVDDMAGAVGSLQCSSMFCYSTNQSWQSAFVVLLHLYPKNNNNNNRTTTSNLDG